MKQMDRRLLILMRLREEVPVRAADLAEECECSVRTVYRDIDALCQAGVPVAAMPGEGYRLVPGYHLPPVALTAEEAVQLLLGSDLALGMGTAADQEATRAAAAKVEAVLTPETRRVVQRLRERIKVSRWNYREPSRWLPVLQQAVLNERVLDIEYHSFSSDEVTERQVEPYYLLFYDGDWHLVGHCRLRNGVRDFRAGRVRRADLLDEPFARPARVGLLHEDSPRTSGRTRVWIEAAAVPWARESPAYGLEQEEPAEGGTVFVYRAWDERRLLPWVLSWGTAARVLEPPDAVESVRRQAEALARRYAEG